MRILKTKSEHKYLNKVGRRIISNKTKYFRRPLHLNHEPTNLNILRIKTKEQFELEVSGFLSMPRDVAFFIYHIDEMYDFNPLKNLKDSELIITDSKSNTVISLNEIPKNYPTFFNVWIVKKNTIGYLKIKLGDIVFTR